VPQEAAKQVQEPQVIRPSNFTTGDRPTWELYSTCIHCGLCLQQCPTYRILGLEADSPRGRIYQVLQVDAGELAIGNSFVQHIDRCLGCLACQTACPSGVHYGRIVERARAEIEENYPRSWMRRTIRDYVYRVMLTRYDVMRRWAKALRLYQVSGLQRLVRVSGLLHILGLASLESLAPTIDREFFLDELGMTFPARGEQKAKVALLAGCIASVAFSELNRAAVRVLVENGVTVVVSEGQGCCGALHAHAGYREQARALARRNIDAMLGESVDAIVSNAAGCGAALKEYRELLEQDTEYVVKAAEFAARVKDISEFLVELGVRPVKKRAGKKITYQDPCHLAHAQRIRSAPRQLLQAIGAELVEMPHSDYCCGSAGTYNVVENELSMKILEAKMDDICGTDAEIIATANVGCMLQLGLGVKLRGTKQRVAHVIELLDEAYRE